MNLVGLVSSGKKAFPIARQALATYRDTVVTFGAAVNKACEPDDNKPCTRLENMMKRMSTGAIADASTLAEFDNRIVRATWTAADKAAKEGKGQLWALTKAQRNGLTYHLDKACEALTAKQIAGALAGTTDLSKVENCGGDVSTVKKISTSTARATLIGKF